MSKNPTTRPPAVSRRSFLCMAAGAALGVMLPGCRAAPLSPAAPDSGWTDTRQYAKSPPWRIGRAGRGDLSSWHLMLSAHIDYGIKEKHRDLFGEYLSTSANWDADKQVHDLEILLAQGLDLLLVDAMDDAAVVAGVRSAAESGVPVILVSAGVDDIPRTSWVSIDDRQRGEFCADWLSGAMSGGTVFALQSIPAHGDESAWLQGVRDRVDGDPKVVDLQVATSFWSPAEARSSMSALLDKSGVPDGLIVQTGSVGQGAVEAMRERGYAIPPVAGGDDSNGWLRTAKEHGVRFLGLGGGANLGLRCVDLAVDLLSGRPLPAQVEFPYAVFDQSALDRYYRPELSDYYWAIHELPATWIERMFRV